MEKKINGTNKFFHPEILVYSVTIEAFLTRLLLITYQVGYHCLFYFILILDIIRPSENTFISPMITTGRIARLKHFLLVLSNKKSASLIGTKEQHCYEPFQLVSV